jgi:hypothetical protein
MSASSQPKLFLSKAAIANRRHYYFSNVYPHQDSVFLVLARLPWNPSYPGSSSRGGGGVTKTVPSLLIV